MKLLDYTSLRGIIRLKTGLYIGTGEEVGKMEALPVMRSIRTGLPYIPGSSIKGKMRSLIELTYGKIGQNGGPCDCGTCQICILFGSASTNTTNEPTRLIFRDIYLTPDFEKKFREIRLEKKPGIRIDRTTGTVPRGALFHIHRVPEGFEFDLQVTIRIFEKKEKNNDKEVIKKDNKENIKKWLATGLFLMEQDTLGGGGTRGSGYVEFDNIKFDGKDFDSNWREQCKEEKDELLKKEIHKTE
jgi:CRISPR-associated protein Csm3